MKETFAFSALEVVIYDTLANPKCFEEAAKRIS